MSERDTSDRERCPDCKAEMRLHEQGYCPYEIETGERITESPLTGETYRVTKWVEQDEGRLISLRKEPVDGDNETTDKEHQRDRP